MLSVLLTIGKGIGVILLALLLLLLFLLCMVLFVPVRYTGKAEKKEEIKAFCRVGWLCRIISFCIIYDSGGLVTQLKIFGIPLKQKKKPASDAVQKLEHTASEGIKSVEDEAAEDDSGPGTARVSENLQEDTAQKEAPPYDSGENQIPEDGCAQEPEKNTVFTRILDKIRKIRYTTASICDKILQIKDNIAKYLEIWHDEKTQEAFSKCRKELVRLLRHIRPRKLRAEVTFGMEDPALTGEILGAVSIFYAYIGKNVLIYPDFENAVLAGNVSMKGRIRTGTLLLIAGRLYFDKNIRNLIHQFRKERADGQ